MRRFTLMLVALCAAALTLIPAGMAGASPKATAAAFKGTGKTSQGGRVVLLLASSGRRVQMTMTFQVPCNSGGSITDTETITSPSRPGGFRGHSISRVKFSSQTNPIAVTVDGVPGLFDVILSGNIRLDTGNAKGTIQPTVALNNGDTCTSGNTPITWSARF
ncbi:MAG TPA: hypothetical protein VHR88_05580 [Solirubrobacteraceae bacterium]|nr:hypothetical protein [Solirubrobacteraceae bacterium]